ncbi:cytochrome c oxidase subunit I [Candidatus Acetothermia bacterium]|nr:cytochrome c oxidase subunit I [Candidatus Acetothermia bacterium]MBI3644250.1 cytochrome c oxidase subunit I [Candidatus Acetothermia bacterium]
MQQGYALDNSHGHHKLTWRDWIFTTNHKQIGILYIGTAFFFFLVGGVLALLMRVKLAATGTDILGITSEKYNELITLHGTVMIFMWVMPVFSGFINFIVPLMIGAKDMAFPRLNALSYWLLISGSLLMMSGFVLGGLPDAGWTMYAPWSILSPGIGSDTWILGVQVLGFSSIFGGVNFIVTILRMRTTGMTFHRMPLFVWASFVTAALLVLAIPALTVAVFLVMFDRHLGTTFFSGAGGDALLYQNLFWFFGHPEVYILILPAFGIVSEILPVFARKPIFGYKAIAYSSASIGAIGFFVWAHHMFTSGMPASFRIPFMVSTMIVGVPTAVKIFNWTATLWRGKLYFKAPMVWALGFITLFLIGGLSGIFLASVPFDIHVQDTYFVVAHFHYVLFGGAIFGIFAGLYFWLPKMFGKMYSDRMAKAHFWLTFIGFNMTFFPMHQAGVLGMARRYADHGPEFSDINLFMTIGAFVMGLAQLIFIWNMVWMFRKGPVAGDNPWNSKTLEWQLSSPPPAENFETPPVITEGPYEYGLPYGPRVAGAAAGGGEQDHDFDRGISR